MDTGLGPSNEPKPLADQITTSPAPSIDSPAPAAAGSTDGITSTPPASEPERIPLPPVPPRPKMTPEQLLQRTRLPERLLVGLLVVFAVLVASFKAANTDLFLHLATGRLIVEGNYTFGQDPFTYTAESRWVNHAWLFDVFVYALYSLPTIGGEVLVAVKALLIGIVAVIMLRTAMPAGARLWLPGVCTLLGVLVLSSRLLLQPTIFSYLLLALTLFLLVRSEPGSRRIWWLPVLCVLWVNCDAWFLLGPLAIALYTAGLALQAKLIGPPQQQENAAPLQPTGIGAIDEKLRGMGVNLHLAQLVLVLVASLAACVLNPNHVFAFQLPTPLSLSATASVMRQEPQFRSYFLSPFGDYELYFNPTGGLSVAGQAYFVLLVAGLVSFVLVLLFARERLQVARVLVWLGLAILSGLNWRAIPFFAIVAGPLLSLTFLDLATHCLGTEVRVDRPWRRWSIAGRWLSVFAALAHVVACYGGYTQSQPYYLRQPGLGIDINEGLQQAALRTKEWRDQGLLPAERRWFNTSPEVVGYFAWYCPGERFFLDHRMLCSAETARKYQAVRQAIAGREARSSDDDSTRQPGWRRVFRGEKESGAEDVRFVVYHERKSLIANEMLLNLYRRPKEFLPCFIQGETAVLAWRDVEQEGAGPGAIQRVPPFDPRLGLDFPALAFGNQVVPAPAEGKMPGVEPWWRRFDPPPRPNPHTDTAMQHVRRFEALQMEYTIRSRTSRVAGVSAGLVGLCNPQGGPLMGFPLVVGRLVWSYGYSFSPTTTQAMRPLVQPAILDRLAVSVMESYARGQDSGPPESLYLAVREVRHALASNPDELDSHLVLAHAYTSLAERTRERPRTRLLSANPQEADQPFFPLAHSIRQAQIVASLRDVLDLSQDIRTLTLAHQLLIESFHDPACFDLRVHHLNELSRLANERKYLPSVQISELPDALDRLKKVAKEANDQLKPLKDRYTLNTVKAGAMRKAQVALDNKLAQTALKELESADAKELLPVAGGGEAGVTMLARLLLATGQLKKARDLLVPDAKDEEKFDPQRFGVHPLGLPAHPWLRVQLAAASGNYQEADEYLAKMIADVSKQRKQGADKMMAAFAEEAVPAAWLPWPFATPAPGRVPPPPLWESGYWDAVLEQSLNVVNSFYRQEADLNTIRGWLALEQGDIRKAREAASQAVSLSLRGKDSRGRTLAVNYPGRGLAMLVLEHTGGVPEELR